MALEKDNYQELLWEAIDTLLSGQDVDGVSFATHVDGQGDYITGFDEPASMMIGELDSASSTPLLRTILALRNRDYELAREYASEFFTPLEELAEAMIKEAAAKQEDI